MKAFVKHNNPDNPLRASVLMDPAGKRINTKDNTQRLFTLIWFQATKLKFKSQQKAAVLRTKPDGDARTLLMILQEWVEKTLPTMGAGWCPPGMLGIGIGGTARKQQY
ncbi:fumarate hydratase [Vibrio lentus]|nr:fumarate hydratase [Vibrio lentus]